MTIHTKRFALALERIEPAQWRLFEQLASTFLAAEFDSVRSTATQSGDLGRDGELFNPNGAPRVLCQYSVTANWKNKIRTTLKQIKHSHPEAVQLIYVTNQLIGANGDKLQGEARQALGISLDIRDASWFLDRLNSSPARMEAAESLAKAIVDPYLSSKGVQKTAPDALNTVEIYAAATFLGLHLQDSDSNKGLTKIAFEALVKASLLGTDATSRISREDIYARVLGMVPGHRREEITPKIDSAIARLSKTAIRAHGDGTFCLSFEESERLKDHVLTEELAESALTKALGDISAGVADAADIASEHRPAIAKCLRRSLTELMNQQSQAFAVIAHAGNYSGVAESHYMDIVTKVLSTENLPRKNGVDWPQLILRGLRYCLNSNNQAINTHLRTLSNSYTLLAFLNQTPDIQSASRKMFAHGTIWLDTTVILPLLAETLSEDEDRQGQFTAMFASARAAGITLCVTDGVLEEIEGHMNRVVACASMPIGQWNGDVPYLLTMYIASGRDRLNVVSWLDTFRGRSRPRQDLEAYVKDVFGIQTRTLADSCSAGSEELRHTLQRIWFRRYEAKYRRLGRDLDTAVVNRLISHDIECYVGVVQSRASETDGPFGYNAWWLTLDRKAFLNKADLSPELSEPAPASPVMSIDFLVNYLCFGPARRFVSPDASLPLLPGLYYAAQFSRELIDTADKVRQELAGMNERVIRRNVRDRLDYLRMRIGPLALGGVDGTNDADDDL